MPSIVRRPNDLFRSGPCVEVKLWVPSYVNAELAYQERPIPPPIDAIATIDTGAHWSIIPIDAAARLGLTPLKTIKIMTPSHHRVECYQYRIRLLFSNGIDVDTLAVGAPWPVQDDQTIVCSIGRDVLKHGLLIYNGLTNMFSLIF